MSYYLQIMKVIIFSPAVTICQNWSQLFLNLVFPWMSNKNKASTVSGNSYRNSVVHLNLLSRVQAGPRWSARHLSFLHQWLGREGTCGGRLCEKKTVKRFPASFWSRCICNSHSWQTQQRMERSREQRSGTAYLYSFLPSSAEAVSNTICCCHWQPWLPW